MARRRETGGWSELGRLLVALRGDRTQTEAAALIDGVNQKRLSRAENDDRYPLALDQARRYAAATRATPEQADQLLALTAAAIAAAEANVARHAMLIRRGAEIQQRTRDLTHTAHEVWSLQNRVALGNFQTDDYTQAMLTITAGGDPGQAWWAARRERIAMVDDDTRRWRQVMSEAALRRGIGSRAVMAAQCEYLIEASRRPNVQLGIIRLDRIDPVWPAPSFHIYRRPDDTGTVETTTPLGALFRDDPDEVTEAAAQFDEHASIAVFDDEARTVLQTAARRWGSRRA